MTIDETQVLFEKIDALQIHQAETQKLTAVMEEKFKIHMDQEDKDRERYLKAIGALEASVRENHNTMDSIRYEFVERFGTMARDIDTKLARLYRWVIGGMATILVSIALTQLGLK